MTNRTPLRLVESRCPTLPLRSTVRVPPALLDALDRLVERMATRTGEPPVAVRRAIEIAVLQRGVAALEGEL